MKNIEGVGVEKQINMIIFHCTHEWNSKIIKENSYPPPTFSKDLRPKRKCLTFSCPYLLLKKNLLFSQYCNHIIHFLINMAIWVSSLENESFCTRILLRTWGSWTRPGTIAQQARCLPASWGSDVDWWDPHGENQLPLVVLWPPHKHCSRHLGGSAHMCAHWIDPKEWHLGLSIILHTQPHTVYTWAWTHTYRNRRGFYCLKYILIIYHS